MINSLSTTLTADAHKACVDLFKTQALNVFVAGLSKDLALLVKAQKPDSLEDAISIAINEEQEIRSKFEIQKFRSGSLSGQFCNFCRKSGHSITNCRNKFNNRNLHVHHMQDTTRTFSKSHSSNNTLNQFNNNNNFSQGSGSKFCYYCKIPGHISRNCRKKQRDDNHKIHSDGTRYSQFNNCNQNNRSYGNSSKYDNRNGNNCSTNDNTNNSNLNFPGPSSLPAPLKATHILQAGSQL